MHEFLHALGFYHQIASPDRDQYIYIFYENIKPEAWSEFKIMPSNNLGYPYDINSIMHYDPFAFTKNGKATIQAIKSLEGIKWGREID